MADVADPFGRAVVLALAEYDEKLHLLPPTFSNRLEAMRAAILEYERTKNELPRNPPK